MSNQVSYCGLFVNLTLTLISFVQSSLAMTSVLAPTLNAKVRAQSLKKMHPNILPLSLLSVNILHLMNEYCTWHMTYTSVYHITESRYKT